MPVKSDIVVIPNFLDCRFHRRTPDPALRARFCAPDEKLVIHISNLRPVKQVDAVVRVFARIRERVPARLLIVGEGPELGRAEQLINELGVTAHVELVGEAQDVIGIAVGVGSVPVAVAAGKLRPVGARGDGVRRAGGGVERRRVAGSGDRRRDRLPASADRVEQMAESAIRICRIPRCTRGWPPRACGSRRSASAQTHRAAVRGAVRARGERIGRLGLPRSMNLLLLI